MKKALIVLIISLIGSSAAFGDAVDEGLGLNVSQQVRTSTREIMSAGVPGKDAVGITGLMARNMFQERQILQIHENIRETAQEGLPLGPVINKVREGIAKKADAGQVVKAVEQTRSRYSYAYRQARSLNDNRVSSPIGEAIAEGMAAGMGQGDMDKLMSRLKTRERTMTRDQLHSLAEGSFSAARDMARSGVPPATSSDVICRALEHSWQYRDMERLRSTFMAHARTGNAEKIAMQYARAIENGEDSNHIDAGQNRGKYGQDAGYGPGPGGSGQGAGSGSGGSGSGGSGGSGHGTGSGHGGRGGM